eukprot:gene21501-27844_t
MSRYISSPIIHGSVAHRITGKKPNDSATHRWTVYIRGQDIHDDLSSIVSKVVFSLHPSFDEPIREVRNQPFEVTESGWGEFEVGIKVFFCEKDEQPVDMIHMLKLYAAGPAGRQVFATTEAAVVSEAYEEIVFSDPSPAWTRTLQSYTLGRGGSSPRGKKSKEKGSDSSAPVVAGLNKGIVHQPSPSVRQSVNPFFEAEGIRVGEINGPGRGIEVVGAGARAAVGEAVVESSPEANMANRLGKSTLPRPAWASELLHNRRSGGTFRRGETRLTANRVTETDAAFVLSGCDVVEQGSRTCTVQCGVDEAHRSQGLLQTMGVQQRDHSGEDRGGGGCA